MVVGLPGDISSDACISTKRNVVPSQGLFSAWTHPQRRVNNYQRWRDCRGASGVVCDPGSSWNLAGTSPRQLLKVEYTEGAVSRRSLAIAAVFRNQRTPAMVSQDLGSWHACLGWQVLPTQQGVTRAFLRNITFLSQRLRKSVGNHCFFFFFNFPISLWKTPFQSKEISFLAKCFWDQPGKTDWQFQ